MVHAPKSRRIDPRLYDEMFNALKQLTELCSGLADSGYVHKDSLLPITWSPDGHLAQAQAVIAKAEGTQNG